MAENTAGGGANSHPARRIEAVKPRDFCKSVPSDSTALCVTCDRDTHAANLLAQCHVQIPVFPYCYPTQAVEFSTAACNMVGPVFSYGNTGINSLVAKEFRDSTNDDAVVPDRSMARIESSSVAPVADEKAKVLLATDREARVLRYREKRKKRKFEKMIRYASRKAYAERRPRIKGRFAKKRTESKAVLDVDRWWFSTEEASVDSYGAGVEYGVVPSF